MVKAPVIRQDRNEAPLGRRERRKRELRQRIYRAAARLFLEQGFAATTVEQIASEADVAQATFFNHFASKHAVLQEMSYEVLRLVQALVENHRKQHRSTQQQLVAAVADATLLIEHTYSLAKDVLLELMRSTAAPGSAGPVLARMHEILGELIQDGQARGDVRRDQDARFLAEIVVAVFHGTISNWVNEPDYPLADRMQRAAIFLGQALEPRR